MNKSLITLPRGEALTNEDEQTSFMDKVRPSSEAFQVTYDYDFLQEVNPDSLR